MEAPLQNITLHPSVFGKLTEILRREMLLYRAARDAEWQLYCYGISEDGVIWEQFSPLAAIIDSFIEQLEASGLFNLSRIPAMLWQADRQEVISRRHCYSELLLTHRDIISCLQELLTHIPENGSLACALGEAVSTHCALSERLSAYTREPEKTIMFTGQKQRPCYLFDYNIVSS